MSEYAYKLYPPTRRGLHPPTNIWGGVSSSPLQMWLLGGMNDGEIEIPQREIHGVVVSGHLGEVSVRGVIRRTWDQAHRDAPYFIKDKVGGEYLYREIEKALS